MEKERLKKELEELKDSKELLEKVMARYSSETTEHIYLKSVIDFIDFDIATWEKRIKESE